MEYWDVYDKSGNFLRKRLPKGSRFGENEYHFAVEAWLINDKHELLIQKRSEQCEILPGHWALTTGRIMSGEDTVKGCIREIKEELGINITAADIRRLARFSKEENHIIWDVFLVKNNTPAEEFSLQKEEVASVAWVSIPLFRQLIREKKIFVYAQIEEIVASIEKIIAE